MHAGELAELKLLEGLAAALNAAPKGARGALVAQAAQRLGVSTATVYSRLRKVGWTSGRKLRADRGDSRVSEQEVRDMAAMVQATRRLNNKEGLSVKDALDMARSNGLLRVDISTTTVLRLMRRYGCHPDQLARPSPHTSMRSLHPNHVWQLDASVCVLYYLKNGRAQVMDERRFNARKPKDLARISNLRVLRYALTDHFSGNTIARYYQASGEDTATLFDFLMHAMHPHPARVMHGVCWLMVWDAASANQSHGIKNLLDALGVQHWAHIPGNPRAKGQVESVHNVIERSFEGRLSFVRVASIEQLNAELDTWLKAFNGKRTMRRHGHTRDGLWQTIRADQLRLCPPVAECEVRMHSRPEKRRVAGNLTLSFNGETYSVAHIEGVRVGDRLDVIENLYQPQAIYVLGTAADGQQRHYECLPVAKAEGGFFADAPVFGERYAAPADTDLDTARKDAAERAYGERDPLQALSAKARGKVAFDGQIDPFKDLREAARTTPDYLRRPGSQIHLANPLHMEERPLSLVELAQELRARRGHGFTAEEHAAVAARYPEAIPADELEPLIEALLRGELPADPSAPQRGTAAPVCREVTPVIARIAITEHSLIDARPGDLFVPYTSPLRACVCTISGGTWAPGLRHRTVTVIACSEPRSSPMYHAAGHQAVMSTGASIAFVEQVEPVAFRPRLVTPGAKAQPGVDPPSRL